MSLGFTLGDRLGLKVAECRVRGCARTWTDLASNPKLGADAGSSEETKGMCESCRRRWPKLADREMPCARPGCEGTFHWSRESQMESLAAGRPEPRHFCGPCDEKLKGFETIDATCAVPGCGRTTRLTPKQQLLGEIGGVQPVEGGTTYAGALCKRCAEKTDVIKDVQVACGIQKCKRTWTWKADEQMQTFAAGKPDVAPRRMCEACREAFGKLLDRDVRCRASGCKKTWHWTREEQLDACVADKPLPKPPSHLCEDCFKIWSGLKDTERPCRRSGCKNTWIEKRGAQLARALRGKSGDPFPQFCTSCAGEVDHLKDREVPCKTEGCKRTWTWSAQQQFVAGVRPEMPAPIRTEHVVAEAPTASVSADDDLKKTVSLRAIDLPIEELATAEEADPGTDAGEEDSTAEAQAGAADATADAAEAPAGPGAPGKKKPRRRHRRRHHVPAPNRHCGHCTQFLAKHKTIELPCAACGTPIFWPPESQLQTDLGNWEIPKLCGACKRDATEADRQRAKGEIISHSTQAPGSAHPNPGVTLDAPAPTASEAPAAEEPAAVAEEPAPVAEEPSA